MHFNRPMSQGWASGMELRSIVVGLRYEAKPNPPPQEWTNAEAPTSLIVLSRRDQLTALFTRVQAHYLSSVDPVSNTSVPHATTTQPTLGKWRTSSKRRNHSTITFACIHSDARKPSHWRSCPSDRMMSARPRTDAVGNASVLSFGRLRHLASNQGALPKRIARIEDLSG
jgi:hypothetical protein